ncbi:hypothetical protein PR048_022837 [Dryococelus australis]|uniref:Uncharacterized protein n=1 Tax=Dryococelus australis TaxID=614101 RepID=A0ABQ9GSF1_9NEOP|nr:hypothetical protein PR048_022837 [Dryococelus australis]
MADAVLQAIAQRIIELNEQTLDNSPSIPLTREHIVVSTSERRAVHEVDASQWSSATPRRRERESDQATASEAGVIPYQRVWRCWSSVGRSQCAEVIQELGRDMAWTIRPSSPHLHYTSRRRSSGDSSLSVALQHHDSRCSNTTIVDVETSDRNSNRHDARHHLRCPEIGEGVEAYLVRDPSYVSRRGRWFQCVSVAWQASADCRRVDSRCLRPSPPSNVHGWRLATVRRYRLRHQDFNVTGLEPQLALIVTDTLNLMEFLNYVRLGTTVLCKTSSFLRTGLMTTASACHQKGPWYGSKAILPVFFFSEEKIKGREEGGYDGFKEIPDPTLSAGPAKLREPTPHPPPAGGYPDLLLRLQRHDGNTARLARRSYEALGVRVTVARIAPSLLDLGLKILCVQGQEARERYGLQLHARLAPRRSYAQGVQCFRPNAVPNYLQPSVTKEEFSRYQSLPCLSFSKRWADESVYQHFCPCIEVLLYSSFTVFCTVTNKGAAVGKRLDYSPPTKANPIRFPEGSPLRIFVGGDRAGRCRWSVSFLGAVPFLSPLHSQRCSKLTSLIHSVTN